MSNKRLTILGIVAACMVVWAVVQSRISNRPRTTTDTPTYLIQGLNPDRIGMIVIGTGDKAVTLNRSSKGFVVTNKDNYPANTSEINNLITSCLGIQTGQFCTDDPKNHKDLGVTKEDARNVVEFWTPEPNSTLLTGVIVGKYKEQGEGSYVRMATSDKVYVASETPWIKNQAMDYIDQKLVVTQRENIQSVTVTSPNGQYTLKAKEDGNGVVLENMPAGKKLKDTDAKSVLQALWDIRFTDVKRESADSRDLTFDRKFTCRLKDSTVYTFTIAKKDNKAYVTCQAEFTEGRPTTVGKTETEEQLKEKESKLLADDNAKQFTAKHQGWIYEIAEWKAKNLTKELADLLEDVKEKEAAQEPQESEQTKQAQQESQKTEKPSEPNKPQTEP
jgi:hypothetical protein